ncbi:MAG: GxxExxY protein [Chloroflexi bacterium]|nr:GxxExxY protein [Chloroflexota bacterium]
MTDLLLKDEVYAIVGAAMEVYNELGSGFLEPVYQEAMEWELARRRIPYEAQKEINILYKGHALRKTYVADLVVYGQIIVEIKAVAQLTAVEEAQLLNYLKATGLEVGLLMNFHAPHKLEWRRMVRTQRALPHRSSTS